MTLVKFNPFQSPATFNRLYNLDKFIADVFNTPMYSDEVKMGLATPSVNVHETEADFRLEVAAPGLAKEDFKVNIEENVLTIAAEKKVETEKKEGEKLLRREFGYTAFRRSFTLPETVSAEGITAVYENGILTLTLPKIEVKKMAHSVAIQ
jgi:HSP20 family protein